MSFFTFKQGDTYTFLYRGRSFQVRANTRAVALATFRLWKEALDQAPLPREHRYDGPPKVNPFATNPYGG